MKAKTTYFLSFLLLVITGGIVSCALTREIQQAVTSLARCKFKLASVNNFVLAGIPLSGKSSFNLLDGTALAAALARNELPASFTVNVAAINPNDGTGGTPTSTATLTRFAWTLLVDNTITVHGDISSPITIPGTGQQTTIPLTMNLDLAKFFKEKGYEHIAHLALSLGGAGGSPSRITLRAKPTVNTDFGPITYPAEIDIIDKEFR